MQSLQEFGIALIQALQSLGPGLVSAMSFFSFLGRTEFYLLLLPFIYWSIDRRLALRAILMLLLVDLAGSTCKLLFHQPRPYWIGGVKAWSEGPSYGIPSTHASDSPGGGGD